jgi:hypothetical protein
MNLEGNILAIASGFLSIDRIPWKLGIFRYRGEAVVVRDR